MGLKRGETFIFSLIFAAVLVICSPKSKSVIFSKELLTKMPSLQTCLPPEMANNAIRQYNTPLVVDMVRREFKKHMHETDPEKIQKLKDDAARGLINHMLHESEALSGRKFSSKS